MRALAPAALLVVASACATARERSYCTPEGDLSAPSAQWRAIEPPTSSEALLARQRFIYREDWRLLHWFQADDGRVSVCVNHRGPTLYGEEYVIFSSENAETATAQPGDNSLKMVITH